MVADARAAGNSFHDADARFLELCDLIGAIRKQAHGVDAKRFQGFGGEIVVAQIGSEAEFAIGFDRVEALIL